VINLKMISIPLILILFQSCKSSDSSSSSSSSAVSGSNKTGTYREIGLECYDTNISAVTSAATFDANSPVTTISISGNTISTTSTSSSCTVRSSGRIEFTETGTGSGYSYGTFSATMTSTTINSGTSCTQTSTFSVIPGHSYGSLTPSFISSTETNSNTPESINAEYIDNDPYLALPINIAVSGHPTDICFLIYRKI
jgi:hypothetical protein